MGTSTLLGISGSLRRESWNSKLMREAARAFDPATFTEADLRLPLFDDDLQQSEGIPAAVQHLADQIANADAVIVASPEYNQSLTGVLKNALDWVSRVDGAPWRGKPVAIVSAAAGRTGGARAAYALRLAMMPFRARVLPGPEVMIAMPAREFDEAGRLTNERYLASLTELMADLRAEAS